MKRLLSILLFLPFMAVGQINNTYVKSQIDSRLTTQVRPFDIRYIAKLLSDYAHSQADSAATALVQGNTFVTPTGTQTLSNKTLTAPKIVSNGFIADANGNEYLRFSQNTSAVNEFTITNAITGNGPTLSATGSDTNIPFNISTKGAGVFRLNGNLMQQSASVINIKEDVRYHQNQPNAVGNGTTDDTAAMQSGVYAAGDNKKVLYLPAGTYLIRSQINLNTSGLIIRGAGLDKTIIKIDATYSGTGAVFQANAKSDIRFEDLSITGNAKAVDAAIQINSLDATNKRFTFENIRIFDFWGVGIMMGQTDAAGTHSNSELVINKCIFYNIGNPAALVQYVDGSTINAIHLQQTTRKAIITNNFIYDVAGDGIFSWGYNQSATQPVDFGNFLISSNHITRCWMGIEINGNMFGRNLVIDANTITHSTRNQGYLISVDGDQCQITNNNLTNTDRGLIEYTGRGGTISGNTGKMMAYSVANGGYAATALLTRAAAIEAYGFDNHIGGNIFTMSRAGAGANTPTEFNGIKLISRTTDPVSQPSSYDGVTDLSAYWTISGNTIQGFTHKAIDATNEKIRKVRVIGNTFRSRQCVESPVQIFGYDWLVKGNVFDLSDAVPNTNNFFLTVFATQNDDTKSLIENNTILNDAWQMSRQTLYQSHSNVFVPTTGAAYILDLPPLKSANGTKYKLTVSDAGAPVFVLVP